MLVISRTFLGVVLSSLPLTKILATPLVCTKTPSNFTKFTGLVCKWWMYVIGLLLASRRDKRREIGCKSTGFCMEHYAPPLLITGSRNADTENVMHAMKLHNKVSLQAK